jgi:hypothetical protein
MPGMDTFTIVAGFALVLIVPLGIAAWIRSLGGLDGPTSIAGLFEPVAMSMLRDPYTTDPIVRDDEPVPFRFGPIPTASAAA